MSIQLKIPSVGESITEVEIGEWLKKEGDAVEKDENVVVIETEKATVELPAPESGTITKILKKTGTAAKVGDVIGEMMQGKVEKKKPTETEKKEAREAPSKKEKPTPEEAATQARVMPAAKRVIAEAGLKAKDIEPTGPGGRIQKGDAESTIQANHGTKEEKERADQAND
jgi:2-oxoglutarate dehydrogenase E2 component (dihydrolipoamide succinyltransferase)